MSKVFPLLLLNNVLNRLKMEFFIYVSLGTLAGLGLAVCNDKEQSLFWRFVGFVVAAISLTLAMYLIFK